MLKYFLAENKKTKHTFINKLVWLAPIFTILLSMFFAVDYFQVDSYNWWYNMMLPGSLSLGCCLLSRIDGNMKNKAVIALPIDLKKVWFAKILIGIKNLSISCTIILVCSQLGVYLINIDGIKEIALVNRFYATTLLIITFMWQVPLNIFLENKIGLFGTIILGLGANIFFGIMAVESYWWMIPFSYPFRIMCPVLGVLPNGLLAVPESETFTPELLSYSSIPFSIIVSTSLFLILTYLSAKWYERREV
ncbi:MULTISPECIES: lantibiotic immunity ABC transporter MutE/EpiE family permease subunit [Clostridium]|uniref:Lantibiotic immunity ABC transporter MutE/EpiE family permease subunit n=1 Tax=Clostridium aquiflavi TaxID=3073603 RepID=A0ABU1EDS2_9CLOT|nr:MULTISPECIES: lantibiotic immunity ABC transporter MutE/EpiE family permease subunit [unclassified Clostridium]MDR5586307.1 lantibiotic immunity ABC transporter MutE/EpiE family permease subunit [Clostridium sp. 5N-1]NFG63205.1 lantibiotic immunity ABC transporter MutE/EpiE family permease subunit [Clostridium botulinum]NFQ09083.1 lantibiotic immunity ABC transporter MutE/EpiE family permease subunit [Clostridium botulinum]